MYQSKCWLTVVQIIAELLVVYNLLLFYVRICINRSEVFYIDSFILAEWLWHLR